VELWAKAVRQTWEATAQLPGWKGGGSHWIAGGKVGFAKSPVDADMKRVTAAVRGLALEQTRHALQHQWGQGKDRHCREVQAYVCR
jgi:hypothetical protein